ncbi:MAG TPA: Xaa-Pro peptidase family protein [Chthonomonadaceae bacterium]|nr:Xaa-Pro peptidase family protein [Chthonomonadaceae bacterium]
MNSYEVRLVRVQSELAIDGVDGMILAGTDQMRYLTGWQECGHERFVGLLIPAVGDPAFLVPAMNVAQARETPAGMESVIGWDDATGWREAARTIVGAWGSAARILVDDEMRSGHLLALQEMFPETRFRAASGLMRRLREIKDAAELEAMRRAAQMIDEVFEAVAIQLYTGATELEVAEMVVGEIRVRGSRPSFSPLICFGPNSALPHHHTGDRRLAPGDVVIIDIGCVADGYASDITRTVGYCEPSDPDARALYDLVFRAHHAARDLARPEVTPEAVDAAARNLIAAAGYGERFLHRTGHGIGLSVHEPPDIVKGGTAPLKPGTCFSIEPGVYLPGRFGVRIENIVTVTCDGVASLNAEPDPELRVLPART